MTEDGWSFEISDLGSIWIGLYTKQKQMYSYRTTDECVGFTYAKSQFSHDAASIFETHSAALRRE